MEAALIKIEEENVVRPDLGLFVLRRRRRIIRITWRHLNGIESEHRQVRSGRGG
jgi:hypothetical protein